MMEIIPTIKILKTVYHKIILTRLAKKIIILSNSLIIKIIIIKV